jgi:methionine synthase II (cobalamin-independent)
MKIKTEESLPNKSDKKLSKEEFDKFLNRNNEFLTKIQKKNELILATSTKYDLQTGHKMFSPKTNNFKPHKNYFLSRTE